MVAAKKKATKEASKKPKRILTLSERPHANLRTTQEAADLLGMKDAASIRKLYAAGRLKGRKVGRDTWISLSSIEQYERERQPVGRPMGTISGESYNQRGARETEYQRDYKRKLRAGLIKPKSKGAKGGRSAVAKSKK